MLSCPPEMKIFVSTSKNILKNRTWTFPVVCYFTRKLEFVINVLWVIVDWFTLLECRLVDFSNIVSKTVLWVPTSSLIISSFVQRFCFFGTDIFFLVKGFSCWFVRLLLTSLLKYSKKESFIFCSRGIITNSQICLTLKLN